MAAIRSDLLERIQKELGVGQAAAYRRIQAIANKRMLERQLAALVLAAELNIGIHRYSTQEERAQLSRIAGGMPSSQGANLGNDPVPPKDVGLRGKSKHPKATKGPKDNSVFVVHGRNEALRRSLFAFLRALGLKPMEWSHAVAAARGANPYIGDILDTAMGRVQAVVVLLSPDDEVKLKDDFVGKDEKSIEGKVLGQARPNVLFEAGLALGRHPKKTLLVQVGKVKPFSDFAGKHMLRLTNENTKRNELANRLQKIGCKVDRVGADWMNEGDFTA
jgi:predicted nucleotide-binding protein